MASADAAMYEDKRSGRAGTAIFERPQERALRELEATQRVRRASTLLEDIGGWTYSEGCRQRFEAALGLVVIVEGVETTAQRDCLLGIGVRVAQGWPFDRALPPADVLTRYGRQARVAL